MSRIAYNVECKFQDEQVMRDWIAWLDEKHLADVIRAGAISATVVRFDDELRCEVGYWFADRAAFERYESEFAPALREEGLETFPLSLGLEYARSIGTAVASRDG